MIAFNTSPQHSPDLLEILKNQLQEVSLHTGRISIDSFCLKDATEEFAGFSEEAIGRFESYYLDDDRNCDIALIEIYADNFMPPTLYTGEIGFRTKLIKGSGELYVLTKTGDLVVTRDENIDRYISQGDIYSFKASENHPMYLVDISSPPFHPDDEFQLQPFQNKLRENQIVRIDSLWKALNMGI